MTGGGRKSLAGRAFALFFAVSLAISALVGVAVTTASFLAYERDAEDRLLAQAQACASELEEPPDTVWVRIWLKTKGEIKESDISEFGFSV